MQTKSDLIWEALQGEARVITQKEPLLASYIYACILNHKDLSAAMSFILSTRLADRVMSAIAIRDLFDSAYRDDPSIIEQAAHDIEAVYSRDPAIKDLQTVLLYLKGFHAIQVHRLAHELWNQDRRDLALYIQSRNSEVFAVDIHPASRIGKGVMFDHATGIVIGETAVVEDNVSIMQSVTLGGTGNESGDRHPKIRSGVMIGSGAKVLGNIEVGEGAKIGAGSVVLTGVPAHTTVVGVPAEVVGHPTCSHPCDTMEQNVLVDEGVHVDLEPPK